MLFTESQIRSHYGYSTADRILSESAYVKSNCAMSPLSIPVAESSDIGAAVVAFEDVYRLSEENCVTYNTALCSIAEANQISVSNLAVAVPDWEILLDPQLVNEMANVVISPISESSVAYQFVESMMDAYVSTGDPFYIQLLEADAEGNSKDYKQDFKNYQNSFNPSDDDIDYYNRMNQFVQGKPAPSQTDGGSTGDSNPSQTGGDNTTPPPSQTGGRVRRDFKNIKNSRNGVGKRKNSNATPPPSQTDGGSTGDKDADKTLGMFEKIRYHALKRPQAWIAKKIQALRAWAAKHRAKLETKDGVWASVKKKVFELIHWLGTLLGNKKDNEATDSQIGFNKDQKWKSQITDYGKDQKDAVSKAIEGRVFDGKFGTYRAERTKNNK